MERKIKTGIIGLGNMGSGHARNILAGLCPEIELTAAADVRPQRLEKAKSEYPESVKLFSDAEAMLASGLVEACIVAVPHYDHPAYAAACLRRGIHVMVEKPICVYTAQAREMLDAAKKSGAVFGVMFNQRTNPMYREMRRMVQSGDYGRIRRSNWIITDWYRPRAYYDSGDWRATWAGDGGGVLLNQCPHQLDLWQWICGMPVRVDAHIHCGKWHDIETEDDVTAYVEYPDGGTGVFIASTGDDPGTNRFEITLDRGKLLAENGKLTFWELPEPEPVFSAKAQGAFSRQTPTVREIGLNGDNPQHVGVLNAFAAHILRGEPMTAEGEEGLNSLMISNAIYLSSWLGRSVELPIDEELYYEELKKRIKTSRYVKKQ
ncbi:MAG: Gfo/Idh/MocA family oxidoreductase [Oscillospiraceae bacterium]|jgi:predicted dehydrogenase|nr:Gfo/Idh/MocA family oxidoreductase [Oscillospiraceae bacterium]